MIVRMLLVVVVVTIAQPEPGRFPHPSSDGPITPASPRISDGTYEVGDAGADPDDVVDDTGAIQRAIDRAADSGGGWIVFPPGLFYLSVNPVTKVSVVLRAGVGLRAAKPGSTTLRLQNGQGDYHSILYADPSHPADDVAIRGLNFDQNSRSNPLRSEADFGVDGRMARFVINIPAGHRVLIDACSFFDSRSRNVVVVSGPAGSVSDAVIRRSQFTGIGGGTWDFDHSSVYATGVRMSIVENTFAAASIGANGAHTAVETHGSDFLVADNVIRGYLKGINITGIAPDSDRQVVRANRMSDVAIGMYIWSRRTAGNQRQAALRNLSITDNQISINTDICRRPQFHASLFCAGIALEPASDSPVDALTITHNYIAFSGVSPPGAERADAREAGISLWQPSRRTMSVRALRIEANTIIDPPSRSVAINVRVLPGAWRSSVINGNEMIFRGDSETAGPISEADESAVEIAGAGVERLELTGNRIVDRRHPALLDHGISAPGNCRELCIVGQNSVSPASLSAYKLGRGWDILS